MRSARLVLAFGALALSPVAARGTPSTCASPLWTIVPEATLPIGAGEGIAALSPSDVWVVGASGGQPAAEHWDGLTWTLVPTPTFDVGGIFHKIAAIGPNDIWAVGFANAQASALAAHWDGTAWTVVPTQNPGARNNEFFDVAAAAPNDVWAVGSDGSIVGGVSEAAPLIEHWDGTVWSAVPTPATPTTIFFGVYALSSTDAWAVGYDTNGGVMEHWDGSQWAPVLGPPSAFCIFYDVRAFSDTDIWVVGAGPSPPSPFPPPYPPPPPPPPLALHFDGSSWTMHPGAEVSPGSGGAFSNLFGRATDDLWAGGGPIEHWDGSAWTIFSTPFDRRDIAGTLDGSDLWAAGSDGHNFVVEHALCGAGSTTTTSTSTTTTTLEDTGFIPPDRTTARCECAIGKGVAKLAARIIKCHQARVEGKRITDELAEENCESAAKTNFLSRATTIAANCPCTNPAATADRIESLVDGNNSKIYCSTGAAWGLDDTGNVPSDSTAASCENGLAKGVAKLIGRLFKCHCSRARGKLTDDASEQQCESTAKVKFETQAGSGCDPCEGTMTGLADFFESQVDGTSGLIYCASPSGAFLN